MCSHNFGALLPCEHDGCTAGVHACCGVLHKLGTRTVTPGALPGAPATVTQRMLCPKHTPEALQAAAEAEARREAEALRRKREAEFAARLGGGSGSGSGSRPTMRGAKKSGRSRLKLKKSKTAPAAQTVADAPVTAADEELYCVCRQPWDDTSVSFMVACDGGCDGWFHPPCLGYQMCPTHPPESCLLIGRLVDGAWQQQHVDISERFVCPSCAPPSAAQDAPTAPVERLSGAHFAPENLVVCSNEAQPPVALQPSATGGDDGVLRVQCVQYVEEAFKHACRGDTVRQVVASACTVLGISPSEVEGAPADQLKRLVARFAVRCDPSSSTRVVPFLLTRVDGVRAGNCPQPSTRQVLRLRPRVGRRRGPAGACGSAKLSIRRSHWWHRQPGRRRAKCIQE